MCSTADKPTSDGPQAPPRPAERVNNLHLTPRRRKETLLPQIMQLALEGHSGRVIAEKTGLPKRTVNHWLRETRREWLAKAAEDAAELTALALARFESIYREAMEGWRRSQADKEVRLVEESGAAGEDGPKTKTSVRSETRPGDTAFLVKAMDALKASLRTPGPHPTAANRGRRPGRRAEPVRRAEQRRFGSIDRRRPGRHGRSAVPCPACPLAGEGRGGRRAEPRGGGRSTSCAA